MKETKCEGDNRESIVLSLTGTLPPKTSLPFVGLREKSDIFQKPFNLGKLKSLVNTGTSPLLEPGSAWHVMRSENRKEFYVGPLLRCFEEVVVSRRVASMEPMI